MANTRLYTSNIHEPAQMVERYLPDASFDVVYQVYSNLNVINTLVKHLANIEQIGSAVNSINSINPYLQDLLKIAQNLNHIVSIETNMDFLKQLAPRVSEFKEDVTKLNDRIKLFEGNVEEFNKDFLDKLNSITNLFKTYEQSLEEFKRNAKADMDAHGKQYIQQLDSLLKPTKEWYEQLNKLLPEVQLYLGKQSEYDKRLGHIEASTAVQLWVCTQCPNDLNEAEKLIELSEKLGNDESKNKKIIQMITKPKVQDSKPSTPSTNGLAWNESLWGNCNV